MPTDNLTDKLLREVSMMANGQVTGEGIQTATEALYILYYLRKYWQLQVDYDANMVELNAWKRDGDAFTNETCCDLEEGDTNIETFARLVRKYLGPTEKPKEE